jgi:signal transduction histidine kinase
MFVKLRLQLTGLCAAITVCIFCLFSGLYLYRSEKTLRENHDLAFRHTVDSFCMGMSQQTTISYPYLLGLEQSNRCMIYVWDKGVPLGFNALDHHLDTRGLVGEISAAYYSSSGLDPEPGGLTEQLPVKSDGFMLEPDTPMIQSLKYEGKHYDAGLILISLRPSVDTDAATYVPGGELTMLVLSSRDDLIAQLYGQRLWFLGISLGGVVILSLSAWWITGYFLAPIRENQLRQIRFVSDASHELRTPLAVIDSCISACPPHYKETIHKECGQMSRLIDDMLTLSALGKTAESGDVVLRKEMIEEPDTFLLNICEEMESLAAEKSLSLSCVLPQESPSPISADPVKLRQLLMILLNNALSYTPPGGKVTLTLTQRAKSIALVVADTGIGIAPEERELIFDRFYRGEASRTHKGHFGLGLCIARDIVAAHKGYIRVSDTLGGGSTFSCVLPVR